MKIEKGNAITPCTARISRADIIAKFKLPESADISFVDGEDIRIFDDETVIVAEYTETKKPRAKKGGAE